MKESAPDGYSFALWKAYCSDRVRPQHSHDRGQLDRLNRLLRPETASALQELGAPPPRRELAAVRPNAASRRAPFTGLRAGFRLRRPPWRVSQAQSCAARVLSSELRQPRAPDARHAAQDRAGDARRAALVSRHVRRSPRALRVDLALPYREAVKLGQQERGVLGCAHTAAAHPWAPGCLSLPNVLPRDKALRALCMEGREVPAQRD